MRDESNTPPISDIIDAIATYGSHVTADRNDLRKRAVDKFAEIHGWKNGKHFSIGQMQRGTAPSRIDEKEVHCYDSHAYDHAEYFRVARGKPVAVVVHSYARKETVEHAAERDGLNLRWLGRSWYFPGAANAAILSIGETPVKLASEE